MLLFSHRNNKKERIRKKRKIIKNQEGLLGEAYK